MTGNIRMEQNMILRLNYVYKRPGHELVGNWTLPFSTTDSFSSSVFSNILSPAPLSVGMGHCRIKLVRWLSLGSIGIQSQNLGGSIWELDGTKSCLRKRGKTWFPPISHVQLITWCVVQVVQVYARLLWRIWKLKVSVGWNQTCSNAPTNMQQCTRFGFLQCLIFNCSKCNFGGV